MKKTMIAVAAFGSSLVGCDGKVPVAPSSDVRSTELSVVGASPVRHHVTLGGADVCAPFDLPTGCDANFSLVAMQKGDGTVTGQWQDTFAGGGQGLHVAVDCLNVVGNGAVVGGVITHGTYDGYDLAGLRALTAVVDNGTSANDPPHQMSFSFFPLFGPLPGTCDEVTPAGYADAGLLFDLTHGQVTVR